MNKNFNFKKYQKFLVLYKKDPKNFLFCKLTKRKLFKSKDVILKHVQGKKYKRLIEG